MNTKLCLAGLLTLGSIVAVGCARHQADAQMDQTPAPAVGNAPAAGGSVDTKAVETKATDLSQAAPVVPTADHVSTGADLKKPDAPVADTPKPDAPKVPDPPKPDAPKVPDAPKPDAPAVPDPTVKPGPAAPEPSVKPDAAKTTDAAKAAIEKEVGTQDAKDAAKAPDAAK